MWEAVWMIKTRIQPDTYTPPHLPLPKHVHEAHNTHRRGEDGGLEAMGAGLQGG